MTPENTSIPDINHNLGLPMANQDPLVFHSKDPPNGLHQIIYRLPNSNLSRPHHRRFLTNHSKESIAQKEATLCKMWGKKPSQKESCSCYSSQSWSRRRLLHFGLRLQEFPNRPSVSAMEHIPSSAMALKKWKLMLKSSFLTNPNILRIRVNNRIEEQICTIWLPCNSWYLLPIILDSINPLLFIKPYLYLFCTYPPLNSFPNLSSIKSINILHISFTIPPDL